MLIQCVCPVTSHVRYADTMRMPSHAAGVLYAALVLFNKQYFCINIIVLKQNETGSNTQTSGNQCAGMHQQQQTGIRL